MTARTAAAVPAGETVPAGSARATRIIAQRDLCRQVRHPGALAAQAVQMLFFVLVYAVGFDGMIAPVDGVAFSAYVYPGIIAVQVVTAGIGSGLTYAWDRDHGVLREMLVAPVPRICLPLGKVAATVTLVATQTAAMLAVAPLLGLRLSAASFAAGVGGYAAAAAVFSVIGLLLATLIASARTLQATVQVGMYPLLFLSGSVFDPEQAPSWLAVAVAINPMTYAVDLARHALLATPSGHPVWVDVLVLGGLLAGAGAALRARVGS
ncbi:ABC transporter permease [Actinoplanes teichomyceticus]|uniref:Transport permease protein n=1 Tax=Actinoplanes teichomyceticus TaxID=1867 RepID=A0A561VM39_ACTTI|nr:ABC transporter permease [Actinoplanes teichomyceticus]TWG12652.1 ABC-2 type transport system permease protein [Actinoplanes teichomyceticus]GIF13384.1 transport permease protein [Actinoplanes teichomyceticus]